MVYDPYIALDTDHWPVKTSLNKVHRPVRKTENYQFEEARWHRHQGEGETGNTVYESLQSPPSDIDNEWLILKHKLTQVLKSACGLKKVGPSVEKATDWWNESYNLLLQRKRGCLGSG